MQNKIIQAVFESLAEQKRHDDAERHAAGMEFARRLQLSGTSRSNGYDAVLVPDHA